jgi:hypothetical protein
MGSAMQRRSETAWERIPDDVRRRVVWCLWCITWLGLLAGLFDRTWYHDVVAFSAVHAFLVLALNRFQVMATAVQVRLGYALWVGMGTYAPHLTVFMYIATVGLVGNLFFNYCLMARLLHLLWWNREERFSFDLVMRVFFSPPVQGKFRPAPSRAQRSGG